MSSVSSKTTASKFYKCPIFFSVKPEITYDPKLNEPMTLKSGNTLLLSVDISGVPTPRVRWSHDDSELTVKPGLNIETKDTYSTFTLKGITGENSGKYRVTASNIVDEVSAEFTVLVKGKKLHY